MKVSRLRVICIVTFLILILTACSQGVDSEMEESIGQTAVARAFTQTANAEESSIESTEAPLDITETEIVEDTVEAEEEEETPAPTEISHEITPSEPGWVSKWFYDTDSSKTADDKTVNGGDDYVANLYERPFTEEDMIYRPDIDINKAEISSDDTFYYVTLTLAGEHPGGGLQAAYGVEIDEDRDGRGDLLVIADHPTSTSWSIDGVSVYRDSNNDVGGSSIMRPDSGYAGNGFDQVVFSNAVLDDPDAAWARINTGTPPTVTLAFKKSLVGMGTFVWGVWSADSLLDPALIDLHDNFTESEAGSPYKSHSTYPLKALNLVDNTCRETYGFDATTPIMGLCYVPAEPTEKSNSPQPGSISYIVYDDNYNLGTKDPGESLNTDRYFVVTLQSGACPSSSSNLYSTTANSSTFSGLSAGTYCLKITSRYAYSTPDHYTINLAAGGAEYREFGFYRPIPN
ncbi:hypothetical protein JR338_00805 [Chloroflexota bacterium]|nr:hypothetical protein JR338_00805 [Chloroflexota bacterium]